MYSCRFLITAMYDDDKEVRHIKRLQFTKNLMVSPVGIRAFQGLLMRKDVILYNKGVVYDASSNMFDICLDSFLAENQHELDDLFKF